MGYSITPTFRVLVTSEPLTAKATPMVWNTKINGRPTIQNVKRWFHGMNESFLPGGVNGHCAPFHFTSCKVIRQATGETVVSIAE